jgi:hypothetical protein
MAKPTSQENNTPSVKAIKPANYFVPIVILLGFLAAAITYRIIMLKSLDESQDLALRYEQIADGRDYASLIEDRAIINRIVAQSLHDNGRMPSRDEIAGKVEELAEADDLAVDMRAQRDRFTFFTDVIIFGLSGIVLLFLIAFLVKQRKIHLH